MIALRVNVNGQPHKTVGIDNPGVVTVVLSLKVESRAVAGDSVAPGSEVMLDLGGLETDPAGRRQILNWQGRSLGAGDQITVEILSSAGCDPPESTTVEDPARELEAKRQYLHLLKRELGEK